MICKSYNLLQGIILNFGNFFSGTFKSQTREKVNIKYAKILFRKNFIVKSAMAILSDKYMMIKMTFMWFSLLRLKSKTNKNKTYCSGKFLLFKHLPRFRVN